MRVIVLGLPYFSKKIAHILQKHSPDDRFSFLNTSESWVDKILFLVYIFFSDTIYQIGGASQPGLALKLALFLNKKIIMHWVGSDVLVAIKSYQEHTLNENLIQKSKHLCEVEWIQKELQEARIQAKVCNLAAFPETQKIIPAWPQKFSILCYIGKGREEFYGIHKIISAARSFPQIEFRIVGINQYSNPTPTNMHLLGWVTDMTPEFTNCCLYLRLVDHDGLAFTVLEALSYGRYVAYSYNLPNTTCVKTIEDLTSCIEKYHTAFTQNQLAPNTKGFEMIQQNFQEISVARQLRQELKSFKGNDL